MEPDRWRLTVNPHPLRVVRVRGQVPEGATRDVPRCMMCSMVWAWCECDTFTPDRERIRGGDRGT